MSGEVGPDFTELISCLEEDGQARRANYNYQVNGLLY